MAKVVSRMSAEDIIHTATPSDWVLGSALADAFAGRGAGLVALSDSTVNEVMATDAASRRILRRLVGTSILAAKRGEVIDLRANRVARLDALTQRRRLEASSGHTMIRWSGRWRCITCEHGPFRGTTLPEWLRANACNGRPDTVLSASSGFGGAPVLLTSSIRIGNKVVHDSHAPLAAFRGIVWCWMCGAYASTAPRALSRPCVGAPRPGSAGACCLARLRKGQSPRPGLCWPGGEDEPALPLPSIRLG